ncbi:MAG: ORF6N domain-containing protein [Gammaproteobacteria bacterium]|nr:ORF6N domain-containing protein [Gammaproteobacteria bacterium]
METRIFFIRGQKVILDADLAALYGVPTKRFNEAFKRNRQRFPDDFAFQLTAAEFANLKSQIVTSKLQPTDNTVDIANWSQFATSSSRHRDAIYRPWAFTEHGAIMAASVLNSPRAVEVNVFVGCGFEDYRST